MTTVIPPALYLASKSPRRAELLKILGIPFTTLSTHIDETPLNDEKGEDHVLRLALEKARCGYQQLPQGIPAIVLGSDTIILFDDEILGKPQSREHALTMLKKLSGHTHKVLTAIAVAGEQEHVRLNVNHVKFRDTSEIERIQYWDTGEPQDKAGSYAIQGIGATFIKHLEGSYSGVMGLPLFETGELLRHFGIEVLVDE